MTLLEKYNVSRILLDSDDNTEHNINQNLEQDSNIMEYKEFKQIDVPLRKDQPINLKEIS